MESCSGCKVTRYCSRAHQEHAWKKGRFCHKVMCPLLNRWRKMEAKGSEESCSALFSNFFESIIVARTANSTLYVADADDRQLLRIAK